MKKIFFPLLVLFVIAMTQGCRYVPFLKYRTSKGEDNFPKFKEKDFYRGSDHKLRSAYDITCYDWAVDVQPEKEPIDGVMAIHFRATAPADTILLDLQSALKIKNVSANVPLKPSRRKGDLLFITFETPLVPGNNYKLEIAYGGKPASILKAGPVFWKEDRAGNPRVSTLTQGIGPHFVMPCKDLLYDEPDSCFIRLTVPKDLVGVANGKLIGVENLDEKSTYHYAVINPINVYNISFNVAKFCTFEYPYTDILGTARTIEASVLCEDSAKAFDFYAQTPAVMAELEQLYGPFPWWNDGCRFVQSAVSGGAMEHQSAISMGDILYYDIKVEGKMNANSTLIHELAHEWWGNSITATDYGDAWLHEGMATFSEALVAERIFGKSFYDRMVRRGYGMDFNQRPVIKPFGVRYNSWAHSPDYNIYGKGALFMHTLRMQIDDDSLFFDVLRSASQHFAKSNIETGDLESFMSKETGMDLKPFFDLYLRQNELPKLSVAANDSTGTFYYRWAAPLPEEFRMHIDVNFGQEAVRLYPSNTWSSAAMPNKEERTIERDRSGYFDVEKIDWNVLQNELSGNVGK